MAKEDHNWVGIGIAAALILIGIAAVVGAYRYGFAGIGQFASSIFWWAIKYGAQILMKRHYFFEDLAVLLLHM